jgi:hypothetical protein
MQPITEHISNISWWGMLYISKVDHTLNNMSKRALEKQVFYRLYKTAKTTLGTPMPATLSQIIFFQYHFVI